MPNNAYQRSAAAERLLVNEHRERGIPAYRTPGSRGATDVIVLDHGDVSLIQVKTGGTSAWSDFGPAARERFRDEAKRAGATPFLCWMPAGPSKRFCYAEKDWPK